MNELNGMVNTIRGVVEDKTCPTWCLNLENLAFIKGDKCICDPAKLTAASKNSSDAWKAIIPAIIAMVLMYVGGTSLMQALSSHSGRIRTELSLWERMPFIGGAAAGAHVAMDVQKDVADVAYTAKKF